MKQIAVKGDVYHVWDDTYKDPTKKVPPKPDPVDPSDPDKYTTAPFYDPLFDVNEYDKADTGEEFVYCNGKPVVTVGYHFSILRKDTYRREWELDKDGHLKGTSPNPEDKKHEDKDGNIIPPYTPGPRVGNGTYKDKKKSTEEVDIWAVDGVDFVFIDDVPISCMDGGVEGGGDKWAIIDGKKQKVDTLTVSGEFTECFGHVYFES